MKLFRRLLLALSVIFIIRVYLGSYDSLISDLLHSKIKEYKVPCEFDGIKIVPLLAVRVDGLSCDIPSKSRAEPIRYTFHNVEISPAWKELLTLTPGIKLSIIPLPDTSGKISLVLARSIRSGQSRAAFHLSKFPVGSYLKSGAIPGLSIEGELNGELALNFSTMDDLIGRGNILFEKGKLTASGMEKSLIKIPALQEVNISLPIQSTSKSVTFSPIMASSSFGVLKGEASLKDVNTRPAFTFNGNLLLNDLGLKAVGGFVALAAGGDVSKPEEEWNITATGDLMHPPAVKITPVAEKARR